MPKVAEKPHSDGYEVTDAIMRYVNDKIPWACLPFPGGFKGTCYIIFKGHDKKIVGDMLKIIASRAVQTSGKFDAIINPDGEMTAGQMAHMFAQFGKKYPMCSIGPVDGDYKWTTSFVVHYNGSVILDYAEPTFFDQLDQVLEWVKTHDDLAGFSLQHRNAAS